MAKVVVLGAGISGHTASAHLKRMLGKKHEVIVVSPSQYYQWIPSNIWVGIGKMSMEQVRFKLDKVYKRWGIDFRQAKATTIHPEGDSENDSPFVNIEYTKEDRLGEVEKVEYDYLVNATGPKLRFDKTEGLGPNGHTLSVCTTDHAVHTWKELQKSMELMKQGKKQNQQSAADRSVPMH